MLLRWLYLECWCVTLICTASTVGQSDPAHQAKSGRPDAIRFEEIRAFEHQDELAPPAEKGIVFVGSSSIRLWDLQKWFPGFPVINRGFGGSIMSDSVYFADRIVTKYKPRTVVVYAGDNDVARGVTPVDVADDFREFVAKVRAALPEVRIVYVSIKPSIARWDSYQQMTDANRRIQQIAGADPMIEFVDIATSMIGDDGKPRHALFVDDGLHLSDVGYRLWSDRLRPFLDVAE